MPPHRHFVRGRLCSVTVRQLHTYELYADGFTLDEIAAEQGVEHQAVLRRLQRGRKQMGLRTVAAAVKALTDGRWINPREPDVALRPLLLNYVRVKEQYDMAPVDRRDDMLVRDLLDVTFSEARCPPCSWVCGVKPHEGEVTVNESGRALCAAHHVELEAARGRRSPAR